MAESEEALKSLLMSVKEENENDLQLSIQKAKIMASGPITSWQIDGEIVKTVVDFIFSGSKITVDGDCGHTIRRHLLLGRKTVRNLGSILKSRDITFPVMSVVLPVVIYGCENWSIKMAEQQRIDAFTL